MLDLNKDLRKTTLNNKNKQNRSNDLLDLTGFRNEQRYVCEDCNVQLALYPNGAIDFPMQRGPHYICPQCHIVIDTAMTKPQGMDEIKPVDMSPPSFVIVPEDKGELNVQRRGEYDPEPDEDRWLKNMGATLISKKIDVKSDF